MATMCWLPLAGALSTSVRSGAVPSLPQLRHARASGLSMVEPMMRADSLDRILNPVRRQVYTLLKPIDRGDFKWEFLVPWVNRSLTASDKFIVCSTFIGGSFILQTVFDPVASVGVHLSYIAQFFSFAMGDPIGFRTLAVLTSLLEIGGDLFETKQSGLLVGRRRKSSSPLGGVASAGRPAAGISCCGAAPRSRGLPHWAPTTGRATDAAEARGWQPPQSLVYPCTASVPPFPPPPGW